MARATSLLVLMLGLLYLGACSPVLIAEGPAIYPPAIGDKKLIMPDGYELSLQHWSTSDGEKPKAVILALHGFNDYGSFFAEPADFLAEFGIESYAFDQRGFGRNDKAGFWHGHDRMARDVQAAIPLLRQRHPDLPIYLLGSSMGGAITINSLILNDRSPTPIAARPDGVILVAPAVWGRKTMDWYQTAPLWLAAHSVPWLKLTAQGLDIQPSDNFEMLRALGRDPLIIKETRVDAIWGLVNLMDDAFDGGKQLSGNILLLYGDRDDIVPRKPTITLINDVKLNPKAQAVIGFYQMGYHMLLRDLAAPTVLRDIAHWITDPNKPLPSGADRWADQALESGWETGWENAAMGLK